MALGVAALVLPVALLVTHTDFEYEFERNVVAGFTVLPVLLAVAKLSIVMQAVVTPACLELYGPVAVWAARALCVVLLIVARASWERRQVRPASLGHADEVPDDLVEFDKKLM